MVLTSSGSQKHCSHLLASGSDGETGRLVRLWRLPVDLLLPHDANQMEAWKVSRDVGKVRENTRA
jgi:hypothetical protein